MTAFESFCAVRRQKWAWKLIANCGHRALRRGLCRSISDFRIGNVIQADGLTDDRLRFACLQPIEPSNRNVHPIRCTWWLTRVSARYALIQAVDALTHCNPTRDR